MLGSRRSPQWYGKAIPQGRPHQGGDECPI